jgi:transcriptional regulator with XRE-family HTH domain
LLLAAAGTATAVAVNLHPHDRRARTKLSNGLHPVQLTRTGRRRRALLVLGARRRCVLGTVGSERPRSVAAAGVRPESEAPTVDEDTGTTAQPEPSFGARLRHLRERHRPMSRAVFGGLVGRSEEWVKAVERGRLAMPRLPMLLRMAEVLGLDDLAELTGDQSIPVASIAKASHDATPLVADAMLAGPPAVAGEPDLPVLSRRIDQTYWLWHSSPQEKSAVSGILPRLFADARATARVLDGNERRRALAELARVYHLLQLFFAWQPRGELVWLAADRAMAAAQDADDPLAIAAAARYYAEVYRANGQTDQARAVALDAAALLHPEVDAEQRARWGQLQLSAAVSDSQVGRAGDAWRRWDLADAAATALGDGYAHPWLVFGRADVDSFAVRIDVNLFRTGEALRRADALDLAALPSRTRRAVRLLDIAQAHSLRNQHAAAVHMISRAHRESAESVKFSLPARAMLVDLSQRRSSVRQDARELAMTLGIPI